MPRFLPSQTLEQYASKKKKTEIVIPAWNDIIHLTPRPSYTERELSYMDAVYRQVVLWNRSVEYTADFLELTKAETELILEKAIERKEDRKRQQDIAQDMLKSPTPALAKNFGVIMTALDDVQDFTTTVGVLSRILGRVFKPAELLAIGAFTIGEYLNRLNIVNRLTGGEIARICRLVRELGKASVRTRVKADVAKRMKRLFPSKGELIEILQTTDALFGVGISLGPLVGLAQDLFFGAFKGAPIRFREWKISDRERQGILKVLAPTYDPEAFFGPEFERDSGYAESAANVVMGAEYVDAETYLKALVASIQSGLSARGREVKKAVIDSWEIISGQKAAPKKKTTTETRLLLSGLGIDPYAIGEWPVEGLGASATLQEIMEAYSAQAQKVLQFWREKLGVSDKGLFLDACVKEISLHAAAMFCDDDGVITETLDPHTLIYIHALENNLNPPPGTSNEKFTEWILHIQQQIDFYDIPVPTLRILQEAHHRFFGSPL